MKKGYSMKLFLISAAAVTLALASPALAQDHHDKGHHGRHGGAQQGSGQGTAATPAVPPHQHISPGNTTLQAPTAAYQKALKDAAARNQRERQNNARDNSRHDNNSRGNDRHDTNRPNNDRHDNNRPDNSRHDNNRHDNNWRSNDRHDNNNNWNKNNRHDNRGSWQGRYNRRNVTARHHYRYRGNAWRWPSGHSYRRWTFGMTLPSLFWGSNYWISDYSYYGLAYPPPGTVWVRYGNDAILIDRYSGEILEVVYNQFY
jgi:Ni/Co efflux regulator RcnB